MEIRKLRTPAEYLEAEALQKAVWRFPEREIIPLNELAVVQKHGGLVLGAFEGRRMVAFCFGVPAYRDGRVYHYSRMLGVLPGYQDSGVGYALKLRQREFVLEQGLDLARWTFDPLRSRNSYLNLEKLGCIAREYEVNMYPESGNRFNRGLPSDRLVPEWWVGSRRVRDRLAGRRETYVPSEWAPFLDSRPDRDGRRAPKAAAAAPRGKRVTIEIPDDIDALKEDAPALARAWRLATRKAFLACFRLGYAAVGFAGRTEGGEVRNFYLLERGVRVR